MKEINCFSCNKKEKAENYKSNIKFYVNWIEIFPDQWLCKECKEKKYNRNLILYKMPFNLEEESE